MIYRNYVIRAELRNISQHELDDDGNELEAINNSDECNLEGYYYVDLTKGIFGDNHPTIDGVKREIDKLLDTPTPVFTPLNADRTERLSFPKSEVVLLGGDLDTRGSGKKAIVAINGTTYEVYGIDCGLSGCVCDAYIKEVA
ncbi:hypothetical protein HAV21_03360 [Paenarthrobacter sp. MSM-2-10-13]|uniref:hypothetical protein n=1 Tax=Paenarthrobacter sp. MSM-2-10-13 TaxID=2717318 RepID=UPI00141F622F|nr:hypothetical protein [Paenarthrobacter sp. MSM-2-10-13]NHW45935.1 hypothetical protein [Paenarthrobacter sp. MSM-2-10-13]